MSLTLEQAGTLVAIIAAVWSYMATAKKQAAQAASVEGTVANLVQKHSELAKEMRERVTATEHRVAQTERWQSAGDVKLDEIKASLVELKTMLTMQKTGRR